MAHRLGSFRSFLPLLILAGCVPKTVEEAPQPERAQPISAQGLEGVMGATARQLTARYGAPALDVREGAARKLQFSTAACVLDAYLYPRSGGEAVVTYVDARMPDGRDMDRASCVAALNAKAQVR
jgi:hypothetical protein